MGKITTNQDNEQHSEFATKLKWMHGDYRTALNMLEKEEDDQQLQSGYEQQLDALLEEIEDADDAEEVEHY